MNMSHIEVFGTAWLKLDYRFTILPKLKTLEMAK
jgi:hypothetical protein